MSYTQKVLEELKARYPEQPEFIQAATEILGTIQPALDAHPEYEEAALLERLVEPERIGISQATIATRGSRAAVSELAMPRMAPAGPSRSDTIRGTRPPNARSSR